MSDEPRPDDVSGEEGNGSEEWSMPKPVFRSTEGFTPGDNPSNAVTDEMDAATGRRASRSSDTGEVEEFNSAPTEEMPGYKPEVAKKGGCFSSVLLTVGAIAVVVAAIAGGVYYYLFMYKPAGGDPF